MGLPPADVGPVHTYKMPGTALMPQVQMAQLVRINFVAFSNGPIAISGERRALAKGPYPGGLMA